MPRTCHAAAVGAATVAAWAFMTDRWQRHGIALHDARAVQPSADVRDVVVVGGGIAGSALAAVLARSGYDVLVLERSPSYRDRVRGEVLWGWGVAELHQLDLEKPLLDAGASYATRAVSYDELVEPAEAESAPSRLDRAVPGVAGALCVGHPEACAGLSGAAVANGADVVHGARVDEVAGGPRPAVRYSVAGAERVVRCRIVVGADGRSSTVRRRLGIALHETPPRTFGGGMLVTGLDGWPAHVTALATEGDLMRYVLPRGGGIARLYVVHDTARRRFTGPDSASAFLASFDVDCIPGSEVFAAARPAGPCVFYPLNDSWTDVPLAPGGVLIGDAAGWNDPIIGQGLSIALRDARTVAELLCAGSDWSPAALAPYARERAERMRRLRIAARVMTDLHCTFTSAGRARRRAWLAAVRRDGAAAGPLRARHIGPENVPSTAFEPGAVRRILSY